MKKLKDNKIVAYIAITLGVGISIFSQNYFLIPNQISTGGFSGIATILYYLFQLPVGLTMFILNVPLFLVSFRKLGAGFVIRSLYAMALYSLLTDLFPIIPLTEDMPVGLHLWRRAHGTWAWNFGFFWREHWGNGYPWHAYQP